MSRFVICASSETARALPIYLNTFCERFDQPTTRRERGAQDFHQIMLVLEGKGTFFCEGKSYSLKPGCAFFTRMSCDSLYTNDGGLFTAFLTVKGAGIDAVCEHYGYENFVFTESAEIDVLLSKIREVEAEYDGERRDAVLSAMCYSFFVDFFERLQSASPSTTDAVTLFIEKNYTQRLALDGLARFAGSSVSKLCHDFKRRHGCTVFQYILDLRLRYAREVIKNSPDANTQSVSIECGFEDVSYFCKAYKKKFGRTPMQDKQK